MAVSGVLAKSDLDESQRADARRMVSILTEGKSSDGGETPVQLHNISRGGLMLECPLELAVGEELLIDIPEAGITTSRIVWKSACLYGCRFTQPLPASALSAAELASAIAPAEAEITEPGQGRGSLGKRLAALRQERGLTLAQIADELGVSKPTVWAWEHDRSQPVSSRIGALADALGVPEAELLTGRDISHAEQAIAEARDVVAEAYGCSPNQVRIMIDL